MNDEFWAELRRWLLGLHVAELEHQYRIPSPTQTSIESVGANAVFIDGVGRTREMSVHHLLPEFLFPLPQKYEVTFGADVFAPIHMPIARFTLSSVQGGKAVYRYAGMR